MRLEELPDDMRETIESLKHGSFKETDSQSNLVSEKEKESIKEISKNQIRANHKRDSKGEEYRSYFS